MLDPIIAPNSIVEPGAAVGEETRVWYFCHIREKAKLGRECSVGDYCYIDNGVIVGDNVRIGNNVSLYSGLIVRDNVFIGNGTRFTNVRRPRADKRSGEYLDTIIDENVSIGAGATILGGVKIGKNAVIGDGAVVVYDVPEGIFVVGNPARQPRPKEDKKKQ